MSGLRKRVDAEKKRLYATYGREKHDREGWLPVLVFSQGFVAQGVSMGIPNDVMIGRIATLIANAELWAEQELQ